MRREIEEVFPRIYMVSIPIPNSSLKNINVYFIKGEERTLVLDPGYNTQETLKIFYETIDHLGIDEKKIDFCLSHAHPDHFGMLLIHPFPHAKKWAPKREGERANRLATGEDAESVREVGRLLGLSSETLRELERSRSLFSGSEAPLRYDPIEEGDLLEYAGYSLRVIHSPGHTPDLITLYEEKHKIFFSTDHVLGEISPNIAFSREVENPLGLYLESLKEVKRWEALKVFASHRKINFDLQSRCDELIAGHEERLNEVEEILSWQKNQSVYEIATQIAWKIQVKEFDELTAMHKYLAVSETMSLLRLLKERGTAQEREEMGVAYWS